jgi:hypothetical protein
VTTTTSTNVPTGYSSCAYRLPRSWKLSRTGTGTGTTQVKMDLTGTAAVGTQATDFWLAIDADGDGNFATGTITKVQGANLTAGVVTFNNVAWDTDGNGNDVFTIVTDIASNTPAPFLAVATSSVNVLQHTCTDAAGYLQFVEALPSPTKKFMAIHPRGNTGYSFTGYSSNDSASYIANQMKTDGLFNTTALMNRMFSIDDASNNIYLVNGGMTVRLYYTAADSAAAMAALDPSITTGVKSLNWFKVSGSSLLGVAASVKLAKQAQTAIGMSILPQYGATLLTPARYGTESGIRYVEFDGVKNFSTFGAFAKREPAIILPIKFVSNTVVVNKCTATINWSFANSISAKPTFEVERSSNGADFKLIGKINSQSFIDNPPAAGVWYYRIKATDIDGSSTYSTVMVAHFTSCINQLVRVYPNPADEKMNILVDGSSNATCAFNITDALGKKVVQGTVQQTTTVNVSNLLPGMYMVNVYVGDAIISKKVLISHAP